MLPRHAINGCYKTMAVSNTMNLLQKYKSFSINYNYLEKKYNFASKLPLLFKLCLHLKEFH